MIEQKSERLMDCPVLDRMQIVEHEDEGAW